MPSHTCRTSFRSCNDAEQTLRLWFPDLKLGQYTKLPPRNTFFAQMAGSVIGSIFNYASAFQSRSSLCVVGRLTEITYSPHAPSLHICSRTEYPFTRFLVMRSIITNNREALLDPVGTRVVSWNVFTLLQNLSLPTFKVERVDYSTI